MKNAKTVKSQPVTMSPIKKTNKTTKPKSSNKKSNVTKPATFDLKNDPNRKEFVSDYTGITDRINRRTKRVEKIRSDMDKGTYKDADTRRHEARHAKYMKRKP